MLAAPSQLDAIKHDLNCISQERILIDVLTRDAIRDAKQFKSVLRTSSTATRQKQAEQKEEAKALISLPTYVPPKALETDLKKLCEFVIPDFSKVKPPIPSSSATAIDSQALQKSTQAISELQKKILKSKSTLSKRIRSVNEQMEKKQVSAEVAVKQMEKRYNSKLVDIANTIKSVSDQQADVNELIYRMISYEPPHMKTQPEVNEELLKNMNTVIESVGKIIDSKRMLPAAAAAAPPPTPSIAEEKQVDLSMRSASKLATPPMSAVKETPEKKLVQPTPQQPADNMVKPPVRRVSSGHMVYTLVGDAEHGVRWHPEVIEEDRYPATVPSLIADPQQQQQQQMTQRAVDDYAQFNHLLPKAAYHHMEKALPVGKHGIAGLSPMQPQLISAVDRPLATEPSLLSVPLILVKTQSMRDGAGISEQRPMMVYENAAGDDDDYYNMLLEERASKYAQAGYTDLPQSAADDRLMPPVPLSPTELPPNLEEREMLFQKLHQQGPNWLSRVGVMTKKAPLEKNIQTDMEPSPPPQQIMISGGSSGIESELMQLLQYVVSSQQSTLSENQRIILMLLQQHMQPREASPEPQDEVPVPVRQPSARLGPPRDYKTGLGEVLLDGDLMQGPYALSKPVPTAPRSDRLSVDPPGARPRASQTTMRAINAAQPDDVSAAATAAGGSPKSVAVLDAAEKGGDRQPDLVDALLTLAKTFSSRSDSSDSNLIAISTAVNEGIQQGVKEAVGLLNADHKLARQSPSSVPQQTLPAGQKLLSGAAANEKARGRFEDNVMADIAQSKARLKELLDDDFCSTHDDSLSIDEAGAALFGFNEGGKAAAGKRALQMYESSAEESSMSFVSAEDSVVGNIVGCDNMQQPHPTAAPATHHAAGSMTAMPSSGSFINRTGGGRMQPLVSAVLGQKAPDIRLLEDDDDSSWRGSVEDSSILSSAGGGVDIYRLESGRTLTAEDIDEDEEEGDVSIPIRYSRDQSNSRESSRHRSQQQEKHLEEAEVDPFHHRPTLHVRSPHDRSGRKGGGGGFSFDANNSVESNRAERTVYSAGGLLRVPQQVQRSVSERSSGSRTGSRRAPRSAHAPALIRSRSSSSSSSEGSGKLQRPVANRYTAADLRGSSSSVSSADSSHGRAKETQGRSVPSGNTQTLANQMMLSVLERHRSTSMRDTARYPIKRGANANMVADVARGESDEQEEGEESTQSSVDAFHLRASSGDGSVSTVSSSDSSAGRRIKVPLLKSASVGAKKPPFR